MSRLLCLVLAALIVVGIVGAQEKPKALSGGTARTASLGGGPYNPYIQDYTDVFVNPANAAMYSDLLYSDVGYNFATYSATGQFVGWTLGLGDLALGVAVGRREGPMFGELAYGGGTFASSDYMVNDINGYTGANFGITTQEPRAPIQVYGAFKMGLLTVGGGIYRSSWSRTDDGTASVAQDQKADYSNSQTGIKGGVLVELTPSFIVDGSFLFRMNSSQVEYTDKTPATPATDPSSTKYDGSGNELAINGRVFFKLSDRTTVIPMVRFSTFSYKPKQTFTVNPMPASPILTTPNDYGRTEFEVGAGINTKFDGGWVVVGASVQSIKLRNDVSSQTAFGQPITTTKYSTTAFDLPKINFGAEVELLSWLSGRFGYFKRLSNQTTTVEPPAPATKTEQTIGGEPSFIPTLGKTAIQQQLAMGLNISAGRLSIDGYMGERVLAAGSWLLSGAAQDIFGVLSLSVKFN